MNSSKRLVSTIKHCNDRVAYKWVLDIYSVIDDFVSFKKLFDKKAMEV